MGALENRKREELGGGGHGRDTGKERVRDGSFKKVFPCFPVHDFFLLLFLCINLFFP